MTTRLDRCPFDVEIGRDVRPADELHSIAAGYTYGYYRSKGEDPEAPEHDLADRVWRMHMLTQATTMQRLADEIMRDSVTRCRDGGASWEEIGQHLVITRQAAQQRFGR